MRGAPGGMMDFVQHDREVQNNRAWWGGDWGSKTGVCPTKYNHDSPQGMEWVLATGTNNSDESIEELLDLARANAQAVIIATTGYLAQTGLPLDGWSAYLGSVFANSWDDSMTGDAEAFLAAALTNYKALGARVVSTSFENGRAEAVITGFPDEDLCEELDSDCSLVLAYHDLGAVVAERLGLTWWWGTDEDRTVLVVTSEE